MGALPTVKSFLGCIDLKVACITIAAFRMVLSFIILLVLIGVYFIFNEALNDSSNSESDTETSQIFKIIFVIYLIILVPIIFINILCSYWFIRGATSNNPARMKYYLIVEGINVVLLLLRFDISSFTSALMECYFLICSNSLYQECLMGSSEANAANTTENTVIKFDNVPPPPPMYSSCEQDMQHQNTGINPQNSGMYPQSSGMYPQNSGMYPQNSGMYPQNTGMYPKINP